MLFPSVINLCLSEEPVPGECEADTEDTDDEYSAGPVRVTAVALTTLLTVTPEPAPVTHVVKKGRFNKTRLGPAANFLIKRQKI